MKKCNDCGREEIWSADLQELADKQIPNPLTGCYHFDGYYCPVCDY